MTNPQGLKNKLGEVAEQLEATISPHYTNLEPWQRGLILIALALFLLFAIYQLTKSEKQSTKKESQREKETEERLLRQMAFFKRLKE